MRSRLNNGWTGGQYSLFRVIVGLYLFVVFTLSAVCPPSVWDAGTSGMGGLGSLLNGQTFILVTCFLFFSVTAVCFTLGVGSKVMSLVLFAGIYWTQWSNQLFTAMDLDAFFIIFLIHSLSARNPYGTFGISPAQVNYRWRLPDPLHEIAWVGCAVIYLLDLVFSVSTELLVGPINSQLILHFLEAFFVLSFLHQPSRLYLWIIALFITFLGFNWPMLFVNILMLRPSWISPKIADQNEYIFYDGICGLCHRWVLFGLSEDRRDTPFVFAPIQSISFKEKIKSQDILNNPASSIVVITSNGNELSKSAAIIYILESIGGIWRLLSLPLRMVPQRIMDIFYDLVARYRYFMFPRPAEVCPVVPSDFKNRFR